MLALLLAIAKAVPAIEALLRTVVQEIDAAREREAQQRKAAKDKAVDDEFEQFP